MNFRNTPAQRDQRGMVLISAILLLLVVTIMALSMFRNYGTQERIAGNTRDKQRAFNAAVSAQQFAESWLSTNPPPTPAPCTGPVGSNIGQICSNPLTAAGVDVSFKSLPWTSYVTYSQFAQNQKNLVDNTISTTGGSENSYYKTPVFYIYHVGTNLGLPAGEVYQIDAVGYGGSADAVAIVESTYVVGTSSAHGVDK
jgi:type IV pilus assembly protein PilX